MNYEDVPLNESLPAWVQYRGNTIHTQRRKAWETANAEMAAQGFSPVANASEIQPGDATYSRTINYDFNYEAGDGGQDYGKASFTQNYRKAGTPASSSQSSNATPSAAAAAPAASASSGGTSANPDAAPAATPSMLKSGVKQDRVETPGALKKYLDNTDTDYNRWLAERNKEASKEPSRGWDRYFTNEASQAASRYGEPMPTYSTDGTEINRKAGGSRFRQQLMAYVPSTGGA